MAEQWLWYTWEQQDNVGRFENRRRANWCLGATKLTGSGLRQEGKGERALLPSHDLLGRIS